MDAFYRAVEELISIALKRIANEYDEGGPNFRAYHNTTHTTNAIESAQKLSEVAQAKARITDREAALCMLAAAYHDVVHNGDADPENEQLSADFASTMMQSYTEFTHDDIKRVQHMILATKCTQKYPRIVQSPAPHDYPAKLLCDADLSSFGKPFDDFLGSSLSFFRELYPDPDDSQLSRFLDAQIQLLSNHTYWTSEATEAYPFARDNAKRIERTKQQLIEQTKL